MYHSHHFGSSFNIAVMLFEPISVLVFFFSFREHTLCWNWIRNSSSFKLLRDEFSGAEREGEEGITPDFMRQSKGQYYNFLFSSVAAAYSGQ